jgi:regulator of protease activity HflC (stomatin/prohibitin superfamily)
MQRVAWDQAGTDESITFNSKEGAILNVDVALSYAFEPAKVPYLFVTFRQDAEALTKGYMRDQVRDAFNRYSSTMTAPDIFGDRKQELLNEATTHLKETLGPQGFKFDLVTFISGIRADEKVQRSINEVIEATQRAIKEETKIRESKALAEQRIEHARGEGQYILTMATNQAAANRVVADSLTPELVAWQGVQKWNGVLPQFTGGAMPFVSLGAPKAEPPK